MAKIQWTPEEDAEFLKALQATEEPTFTQRCRSLANQGWHDRTEGSLDARGRELGYHKMLDYDSVSHSMEVVLKENDRLKKEVDKYSQLRNLLEEIVDRAMITLTPAKLDMPIVKSTSETKHAYWLSLCDWQGGSKYSSGDLAGRGTFGNQELRDAVDRLTEKFLELYQYIHKAWGAERIIINILGDMIEGVNIYKNQRSYIEDQRILDQAFFVEELLYQLIGRLAQLFPFISINCVHGNHGRIGKDYHELDNWDYLIYRLIQRRFSECPNIAVNVSESHAMLYIIPNMPDHLHIISHGEEIRSASFNIPFYNMDKYSGLYSNLAGKIVNYVTIAHHHRMAKANMPSGDGEWLICPPLIGSTSFAVKHGYMKRGAQMLAIFHPEEGKVFDMELRVTDLKKLEPDENGILTPVHKGE